MLDDAATDDPAAGAASRGPRPPAARTGRRWWWSAVPVVVVAALVTAQVVTDARERALVARVRDVAGVVRPLDGVAEVAWQVGGGTRLAGAALVGDVLVAADVSDDHAVALEGRDALTGAVRWRVDVVGPRAAWGADGQPDTTPCAAVPDRPGTVVCLVTDAGQGVVDGARTRFGATAPRLLVLDADDGTVVTERVVPLPVQWLTPSGQDVLLVGRQGDALHVRSQALLDGTEHWHATADVSAGGSGDDDAGPTGAGATSILLDPTTLAVHHGQAVTLLSTGGDVLRTVDATPDRLLTGRVGTTTVTASRALAAVVVGDEQGAVVASADAEVVLDGSPVPIRVDDGSVPGLVLTRTPMLQAWDARAGAARWGTTVVDAQDVTVLRGRVHVGTSSAVVTLDGRTGEELWRAPRPSWAGAPVTDGRHLYVLASQGGRHSRPYDLVALHVGDGSEAWRVPLPADAALTQVAGLLVASGYDPRSDTAVYRVLR